MYLSTYINVYVPSVGLIMLKWLQLFHNFQSLLRTIVYVFQNIDTNDCFQYGLRNDTEWKYLFTALSNIYCHL